MQFLEIATFTYRPCSSCGRARLGGWMLCCFCLEAAGHDAAARLERKQAEGRQRIGTSPPRPLRRDDDTEADEIPGDADDDIAAAGFGQATREAGRAAAAALARAPFGGITRLSKPRPPRVSSKRCSTDGCVNPSKHGHRQCPQCLAGEPAPNHRLSAIELDAVSRFWVAHPDTSTDPAMSWKQLDESRDGLDE